MDDLIFDIEMDIACLVDDLSDIQHKLSVLSAMIEDRNKDKSADED